MPQAINKKFVLVLLPMFGALLVTVTVGNVIAP